MAFQTKTELAWGMVAGHVATGTPFGWVAGDEACGRSSKLRAGCEDAGKGYVFAVPVNFQVQLPSSRKLPVAALARLICARCWQTRSCGRGCKGHRGYAWAWAATRSPRHWVLIRRSLPDPGDLAFFCCHAPADRPVSLSVLVTVTGKRWPVKEYHQQAKGQSGLDRHQVRLWHSFHRHTVLSMCALAVLAIAAARPAPPQPLPPGADPAGSDPQSAGWSDTGILPASAHEPPPENPGLVKVSVPEARRLLRLATTTEDRHRPPARLRLVHLAAKTPSPRPLLPPQSPAPCSRGMNHDQITNRDCSTGTAVPGGGDHSR